MSSSTSETPGAPSPSGPSEIQLVAVQLANEIYGIDIAHIHTVIMPQAITAVPRAPAFVNGVINLRGRVVPAVDMRTRFGLPPLAPELAQRSRIVIVEAAGQSTGIIVDAVLEVLTVPLSCIDPPAQLVVAPGMAECIVGIGRIPIGRRSGEIKRGADETKLNVSAKSDSEAGGERLIILLDVLKTLTLSTDETPALKLAA